MVVPRRLIRHQPSAGRSRRQVPRCAERLESRTLFATAPVPSPALDVAPTVHVRVDYSLDDNHFFDTQLKRDLLQQAADSVVKWFKDDLLPIEPGGGDTWEAVFDDPATGSRHTTRDLAVPANEVVLFAGGRDMADALGRGGPGGYNASGSSAWLDRVGRRGQGGGGSNSAEFGPWGGAITFDTDPASPWHFGTTTSGLSGSNDFLSVASHEVAHLFGFGTSDPWRQFTSGNAFIGPRALSQYDVSDAAGVPLNDGADHWAEGTRDNGQEVAMDPQLTVGTRRLLTPLDYAALDDVGWSMPPQASLSAPTVTTAGTSPSAFAVTYSHYASIDSATLGADDVVVIAPDGTELHPTSATTSGSGTARTATYALPPPGGTWDAADSGTYSVVLNADAVRSSTGEAVAAGTLGTFVADVADPPSGELQPPADPEPGAAGQALSVVYSDGVAVDPVSIDVADLLVTAPDGTSLAATSLMSVDTTAPGPHVTAVYGLAAPGGTWGPEDDGQYTVSLRPGAVRDTSGNVSTGGPIGTFDVSLGSVPFDARNPVTYTDASGDAVTVSMKGPGSGTVRFTGTRPADASAIELHGTTAATTLLVRTGPGGTSVGRITTDGGLKSITGKTTDVVGDGDDATSDVEVSGGVGRIVLRSASGRSGISLGGFATGPVVSLVLGSASDVGVTSSAPFKLIRAAEWLAPTGFGRIQGPGIRSIIVPGTFQADVLCQAVLGSAKLGAVEGSEFVVDAGIGSFVARSMRQSKVLVGLTPPIEQYQFPAAVMRSLTVREFFADSAVDCPNILRASVAAPAGSTIRADRIQRLQVRDVAAPVLRVGLDDPADSFVAGGLTVTLI